MDGLSLSQVQQTREVGHLAKLPMWKVLALQGQETIELGITKPVGVPDVAFQILLNAHNSSIRNARLAIPPARSLGAAVCRRLASLRAPTWKHNSDPLLWMSRVRRAIRTAALSHAAVQSDRELSDTDPSLKWTPLNSLSESAMAAWAYRCWDGHSRVDQVLRELFDQGVLPRGYVVPDYATGHRCLWFLQARGFDRFTAWQKCSDAGLLPDWGTKVSTRQVRENPL